LGVTAGGVVAGTNYKFEDGSTMIAEVDGVIIVALSEGLDAINKLKIGDIITKVDGEVVKTIYDVMDMVNEHNPGDTIEVEYYREGQYHTVSILLGSE
jgi:S1-C subfamily serine protease